MFSQTQDKILAELPRIGLWVEAEGKVRPYRSKAELNDFLDLVSLPGVTDLYCQVYRGGRAWFPTERADDTPFKFAERQGFDPLLATIDAAHRSGKRVHAWINVFRVDKRTISGELTPILAKLGTQAVLMDSDGQSLLHYSDSGVSPNRNSKLDTPGVWLDPSSAAVRGEIIEIIKELVGRYPDLDGIHLDMIRYPFAAGIGFPYGKEAEARFFAFSGKNAPKSAAARYSRRNIASEEEWNDWRRQQITDFLFDLRSSLNEKKSKLELSAAVIAYPERSYSAAYQDWHEWLRAGILDYALPMNYTKERRVFSANTRFALSEKEERAKIIMGLGAWMMLGDSELLIEQASTALHLGAGGVTLFSYANLASPVGRKLIETFTRSVAAPLKDIH